MQFRERCCSVWQRISRASQALAILLLALHAALHGHPVSAQQLSAGNLFDPDRLVDVVITLPSADWDQLRQQSRDIRRAFADPSANPFTYFKGDITIDGIKVASVGVRKKGFIGSLDERWPSLKIKFAEYVDQHPLDGVDIITLNNNKQDPSLVSQFLAYRLFNQAGVHAPRSNFARVTVNGEFLGIYSHVESIGKPFLKRRFGNSKGNLYEGTLADFYPNAISRLEAKTNEKNHDRSKVTRLSKLLANESELPLDEIEKLVDIENFITFWALESLIGFWDGYSNNQNNYWLYENGDNGKFYFMPWGADGAFMNMRGPFMFGPGGATSVYAESMLANRLYRDKSVAERYRQTMLRLLDNVWNENELLRSIDRVEALLKGELQDRQMGAPRAMNSVRQFIRGRRDAITKELETWPVQVAPQPRKPTYTVELGSAQGSFVTRWQDKPMSQSLDEGRLELHLEMNGKPVSVKQLAAHAQLAEPPRSPFGFGGPGAAPGAGGPAQNRGPGNASPRGPADDRANAAPFRGGPFGPMQPPATVVITGVRDSDERKLTITLTIDPKVFASSAGKTLDVQGTLAEGEGGANSFMPFGGQVVEGKLTLAKAGMNAGDAVQGDFDLKIAEMRGGFMDRRGPGRGGRGAPGSPPGAARGGRGQAGFPFFGMGGVGAMQASPMALVGMREVQDELAIRDDQPGELEQLQRQLQEQVQAAMATINFQDIFNEPEDVRTEQFQNLQKKVDEANRKAEQKLEAILDAGQWARLKQLRLQREGIDAFGRADVIRQLALSEAQQKSVQEIQDRARPQFGFGPPDLAQIEEDRQKALVEIVSLLDDSQKKNWTLAIGKEFKFPMRQPGFGGPDARGSNRGGPDNQR